MKIFMLTLRLQLTNLEYGYAEKAGETTLLCARDITNLMGLEDPPAKIKASLTAGPLPDFKPIEILKYNQLIAYTYQTPEMRFSRPLILRAGEMMAKELMTTQREVKFGFLYQGYFKLEAI